MSGNEVDVFSTIDSATSKRVYVMSFYTVSIDMAVRLNNFGMLELEFVLDANTNTVGKCKK